MTFSQELRNKLYAVAGSVVAILTVIGVVDQATGDQALNLANLLLDNVESVVALVGLIVAFVKSLPGKVTTVDVPKAEVQAVLTTSNSLLAGPAADEKDGTVVGKNVTIFDDDLYGDEDSGTLDDDEPGRHVADDPEV